MVNNIRSFGLSYMAMMAILAGLILNTSSCDSFTSEPRFEGDVYSVAALLMEGQAIDETRPVYITKSSAIEAWNPLDVFVTEADVQITELGTGHSFVLVAMIDYEEGKVKWIDPARNIIQNAERYRIQISIPGYDKVISAETVVPPTARLVRDFYDHDIPGEGYGISPFEIPDLAYTGSDARYPLALNLGNQGGAYNLMAELFCLEEFSTELTFTTTIFGLEHPTEDMESAYNSAGEGFRRIRILGKFVAETQPEHEGNFILLRNYRQGFIFYGRYSVSMIISDDNYYRYNYMPEGYLHGGVQNGLGYFGSASGGMMFTNITPP